MERMQLLMMWYVVDVEYQHIIAVCAMMNIRFFYSQHLHSF